MKDIVDASGASSYGTAFTELTGYNIYTTEDYIACLLTKPTKLSDLFYELCQIYGIKSWMKIISGAGYVTIRRDIFYSYWPSLPTYITDVASITDAETIIEGSAQLDCNEDSRISRIIIYYDLPIGEDAKEADSYNTKEIGINTDSEAEYDNEQEITIYNRWMNSWSSAAPLSWSTSYQTYLQTYLLPRLLERDYDAHYKLKVDVELKDDDNEIGDFVTVTTNEIVTPSGDGIEDEYYQIIKKAEKSKGKLELTLERINSYD